MTASGERGGGGVGTAGTSVSGATNSMAIIFILLGMVFISVNDMLFKFLSGGYPLHQMVFVRSIIGLGISVVFLHLEGGWRLLKTDKPVLHMVRAGLIVVANMAYFLALAEMPLGAATSLFFVAPLFITLLAIPVLGEKVGRHRLAAVGIGLLGVAVMMSPGVEWGGISRWTLILPIFAALCYAGMQVLTRKLGGGSAASAMTMYIQFAFIVVASGFFLVVGDGRFAVGQTNEAMAFLLRPWIWPAAGDWWIFGVLGLLSALIGYCLSQAYRLGDAGVIAPYEYVNLPMAIFWGWMMFGEVPGAATWLGAALIAGGGIYVFTRERRANRTLAARHPVRRG